MDSQRRLHGVCAKLYLDRTARTIVDSGNAGNISIPIHHSDAAVDKIRLD